MIIWAAMLIPFLVSFIALLFWGKKIVFWELLPAFVVSAIFIFGFKSCEESVQVQDKEYLMDYVVNAEYTEEWDEWIDETCTRSCCCDSKGENCGTETYDCSYRKYHPDNWEMTTSTGKVYSITKNKYNELVNQFGNQSFVEMNRDFYHIDGDAYVTEFKSYEGIEYVTWSQTYENRVQASHSVFNFKNITTDEVKKKGLYDYPGLDGLKVNSILGYDQPDHTKLNRHLNSYNGFIAPKKQLKVWFLLFKDKPLHTAFDQEAYWKGGNKNELVVCIGLDNSNNIRWTYVFSWTKVNKLKISVRDKINAMQVLDMKKAIGIVMIEAEDKFERMHFREFDYITIDPPLWCIIVTFIIVLIVSIGGIFWAIINEFEN